MCAKDNNIIGLSRAENPFECRSRAVIGHCLAPPANSIALIHLTWRVSERLTELAQQTYGASLAQGQNIAEYKLKCARR